MADLMDMASQIISMETRRIEAASQNIANIATPGYKRQMAFSQYLPAAPGQVQEAGGLSVANATDFTPGRLIATDNPMHFALAGEGFFEFTSSSGSVYSRHGALQLDDRGRLVSPQGWPLQAAGGGDVVIRGKDWKVEKDGTVVEEGRPVSRIRVVEFADPAALTRVAGGAFQAGKQAPTEVNAVMVRQGFIESANVSTADDMIRTMESIRRAEVGQKLVHAYDDMLGQALRQTGQ
ncbi:flagellar hook-basal body protein [Paraherbaspirillum soli]|uniref:Flagellar hook-basal body protein n=1 Tax=Paraherbaspirillum soli TaxID=631222 RepID=A0ABW0MBQ3_9BURK